MRRSFRFSLVLTLGLFAILIALGDRIALAVSGGPDAFGYRFSDSIAPTDVDSPVPNFEVLAAPGDTVLLVGADDAVTALTTFAAIGAPGFTFTYYGAAFTDFTASSNGFITLGAPVPGTGCCTGNPLPTAADSPGRDGVIAAFWEDMDFSAGGAPGSVLVGVRGIAPNRRVIVSWQSVEHFPDDAVAPFMSFQLKLFETSNEIEFHYAAAPLAPFDNGDGTATSIGIENLTGTVGLQYRIGDLISPGLGGSACRFFTVSRAGGGGGGAAVFAGSTKSKHEKKARLKGCFVDASNGLLMPLGVVAVWLLGFAAWCRLSVRRSGSSKHPERWLTMAMLVVGIGMALQGVMLRDQMADGNQPRETPAAAERAGERRAFADRRYEQCAQHYVAERSRLDGTAQAGRTGCSQCAGGLGVVESPIAAGTAGEFPVDPAGLKLATISGEQAPSEDPAPGVDEDPSEASGSPADSDEPESEPEAPAGGRSDADYQARLAVLQDEEASGRNALVDFYTGICDLNPTQQDAVRQILREGHQADLDFQFSSAQGDELAAQFVATKTAVNGVLPRIRGLLTADQRIAFDSRFTTE